jgi:hypothetical protein
VRGALAWLVERFNPDLPGHEAAPASIAERLTRALVRHVTQLTGRSRGESGRAS